MKNIFKAAHKLTREMVKEYEVDYQAQFGLNISYLLEEEQVVEYRQVEKMTSEVEEFISKKELNKKIFNIVSKLNRDEVIEELYSNMSSRRTLKNVGKYDDKTSGLTIGQRYGGAFKLEVVKANFWAKHGKARVYVTVNIDGKENNDYKFFINLK